ncbi:unnamed protein product [Calicophoron daubneyi]|uniref:t-SNARE coiled-coil homology domain-containing protein n=1 Tax=Calicophoron daubneyi TaxID=300641 RepID=A0AAV2TCD0_CALDB
MPRNPFDDDDEPGGFGTPDKRNQQPTSAPWLGTETPASGGGYNVNAQIMDSKARTLASQQRALASIANSERVGVETAAELSEQGEKLARAERRLDDITELQKDSQRQINSLSSLFGGLKNMFNRKPSQPANPAQEFSHEKPTRAAESSGLKETLHTNYSTPTLTSYTSEFKAQSERTDFDRNLSLMSDGMSRLKELAQGMNEELRVQNDRLDRMGPRVENITGTMSKQNQQMNKLLGVKPK